MRLSAKTYQQSHPAVAVCIRMAEQVIAGDLEASKKVWANGHHTRRASLLHLDRGLQIQRAINGLGHVTIASEPFAEQLAAVFQHALIQVGHNQTDDILGNLNASNPVDQRAAIETLNELMTDTDLYHQQKASLNLEGTVGLIVDLAAQAPEEHQDFAAQKAAWGVLRNLLNDHLRSDKSEEDIMQDLKIGTVVWHGFRGKGVVKGIDSTDLRGKPIVVEFANGEVHHYSVASARKLRDVPMTDAQIESLLHRGLDSQNDDVFTNAASVFLKLPDRQSMVENCRSIADLRKLWHEMEKFAGDNHELDLNRTGKTWTRDENRGKFSKKICIPDHQGELDDIEAFGPAPTPRAQGPRDLTPRAQGPRDSTSVHTSATKRILRDSEVFTVQS